MKQFLFLLSFIVLGAMTANAQCTKSASKACCAKKSASANASADATDVAAYVMAADKAAEGNENIEKRVCEKSGNVSYYEKSVCPMSGNVSWNEVKFDSQTSTFTRVASASMEKEMEEAPAATTKACAGQKDGKACSKKDGKACCKKDGAKCAKKA
ncbi:MAG: hypothetical protein H6567_07585 [Lewinellaceae bacterium]|nr:hypothetical protein [Lewinellaceae bacterium]